VSAGIGKINGARKAAGDQQDAEVPAPGFALIRCSIAFKVPQSPLSSSAPILCSSCAMRLSISCVSIARRADSTTALTP
jgi:hypothetical protein